MEKLEKKIFDTILDKVDVDSMDGDRYVLDGDSVGLTSQLIASEVKDIAIAFAEYLERNGCSCSDNTFDSFITNHYS